MLARVASKCDDPDAMRQHFAMILTLVEKALTKKHRNWI